MCWLCVQDCWTAGNGAFTGETSADMLADLGIKYSIVGHSERRAKGETDADVAAKAKYAIARGLTVIACIGETLAQRESGKTNEVVLRQLKVWNAAGCTSNISVTLIVRCSFPSCRRMRTTSRTGTRS
jgi:triosephosphate isomerase